MESQTGEDITCEIGYSLNDTDPSGERWTWTSSWFNGDWGDNFYYQGRIEGLSAGTYYYTFRVRNANGPYKYAGSNGLWDGLTNMNGTFEVKSTSSGGDDDDDGIDYSSLVINWANLQWKDKDVINKGETFNAGSKILVNGLTDLEEPATSANKHLTCEMVIHPPTPIHPVTVGHGQLAPGVVTGEMNITTRDSLPKLRMREHIIIVSVTE